LIKELAQRVGVSVSLISKYENDKLLPPLRVLHRLVSELQTNIGSLFDSSWSGAGCVASASSRPRISAGGNGNLAGVILERVITNGMGHLLQGNIHIVSPGVGSMGTISHEGDEVGYVLKGCLELTIDGAAHQLGPEDSFAFTSYLPHTYRNNGSSEARILWIDTPPTF
jgi:DNA-binding XRE family transcriptional regulator